MSLRIAFDLDGVLADMEGALARESETVFSERLARRAPGRSSTGADGSSIAKLEMTDRQERRLWRHVAGVENFWETLHEIEPGAIARLAQLAAERRWEIIFLTRRPPSAGFTAQVQTQRWLMARGFTLPSVYVVQGNRGRIAESLDLDFVIDDRSENCLDVLAASKARAILVWRDDETELPAAATRLGIGVVKTVDECLGILAQVDSQSADKPGMIDRVMRLLGLKAAAKERGPA